MPRLAKIIFLWLYFWIGMTVVDAAFVWFNIWPAFFNPGHTTISQMAVNNLVGATILALGWVGYRWVKDK